MVSSLFVIQTKKKTKTVGVTGTNKNKTQREDTEIQAEVTKTTKVMPYDRRHTHRQTKNEGAKI